MASKSPGEKQSRRRYESVEGAVTGSPPVPAAPSPQVPDKITASQERAGLFSQVRAVPIMSQEVHSHQILDNSTRVYVISAYFSYFVIFVFELGRNAARAGACRQF